MTVTNIIKGLTIIQKANPSHDYFVNAEHDIIYAGDTDCEMSDADRNELDELGWEIDDDIDRWYAHV
jgi:hypothetical protein